MDKVVEREPLCESNGDHSLVDRLVVDDCPTLLSTKLSLPTTPSSEAISDCKVGPASSSASVGCTIDVAREDIEKLLGKKVFLELFVRVESEWRSRDARITEYGYGGASRDE